MLTYSAKREPNKCTDDHRMNTFAFTGGTCTQSDQMRVTAQRLGTQKLLK